MPCHVSPPKPSLIQKLAMEYSSINELTPAQTQELLNRYWAIRQLIFDMMQVARDVHAYRHSWKSINHFGKLSAQGLQAGEPAEFDRLKALIKQAYETLP